MPSPASRPGAGSAARARASARDGSSPSSSSSVVAVSPDRRRARRPAGPSDRARASAGRAGARAAGCGRRGSRARPTSRRGAEREVGVDAVLDATSWRSLEVRGLDARERLAELGQRRARATASAPRAEPVRGRLASPPSSASRPSRRSRVEAHRHRSPRGSSSSAYPGRRVWSASAGSALRSADTWMWTILTADSGTSSPHRSSTSCSTDTVRPASSQAGEQRPRLATSRAERRRPHRPRPRAAEQLEVHEPNAIRSRRCRSVRRLPGATEDRSDPLLPMRSFHSASTPRLRCHRGHHPPAGAPSARPSTPPPPSRTSPPLLLVAVSRRVRRRRDRARRVHRQRPRDDQAALAETFRAPPRTSPTVTGGPSSGGALPRLHGAAAWFECRVERVVPARRAQCSSSARHPRAARHGEPVGLRAPRLRRPARRLRGASTVNGGRSRNEGVTRLVGLRVDETRRSRLPWRQRATRARERSGISVV